MNGLGDYPFEANQIIGEAIEACKTMKTRGRSLSTQSCQKLPLQRNKEPQLEMEQDFTTLGEKGNLQCPFPKHATSLHSPHIPMADPIAAEFHADNTSGHSHLHSVSGKCPIRFLDQHSPEEAAAYFENHKHEIPRSHEICVKKFASNEESIRELDAKYGNLVSMIQELGVKHKQFLPVRDETQVKKAPSSTAAVKRWADGVSASQRDEDLDVASPSKVNGVTDEDEREPHFERPLREIRVGESPSRPWGISVPPEQKLAASVMSDKATEPVSFALGVPPHVSAGCPVARGRVSSPSAQQDFQNEDEKRVPDVQTREPVKSPATQQITFNGPVFFGYPADQVSALLQSIDLTKWAGY